MLQLKCSSRLGGPAFDNFCNFPKLTIRRSRLCSDWQVVHSQESRQDLNFSLKLYTTVSAIFHVNEFEERMSETAYKCGRYKHLPFSDDTSNEFISSILQPLG